MFSVHQGKEKKMRRSLKVLLIAAVCVFGGWLGGSYLPLRLPAWFSSGILHNTEMDANDKFQSALEIMTQDWFFADTIDDLETRLTDQALYGMTSNEEDTHTTYMSAEEEQEFTDSINRDFVGIGISYKTTEDGLPVITYVIPGSPAEEAGLQAGDILISVDGESCAGWDSQTMQDRVRGEEGTTVIIGVQRGSQELEFTITRAAVSSTAQGYVREDGIGYLQMVQFGNGTPEEVAGILDQFEEQGVTKIIIDLRSNGGGYLTSMQEVGSCFLDKGDLMIKQVYKDGTSTDTKATGGRYESFGPIVLLVSENTASAAEAFTLALMEQRDDVTVIGTTTYGKGTAQVVRYFSDGSAINFTTSKWLSPSGLWINNTGITPDITVELPEAVSRSYYEMSDADTCQVDSVSEFAAAAQLALDFLGYEVDRTDGYFSVQTETALKQFETDQGLTADGILDVETYNALISWMSSVWSSDESRDTQLQKALEVLGTDSQTDAESAAVSVETADSSETAAAGDEDTLLMLEPDEIDWVLL